MKDNMNKIENIVDYLSDEMRYQAYSSAAKAIADSFIPIAECFICKKTKKCPSELMGLHLCDSKECSEEIVRRCNK